MFAQAKLDVFSAIEELGLEVFALNYFMAENPEISGEEHQACDKICHLLESKGIPVERNFAGLPTAFRGTIKHDESMPVKIAILTEYDALPGIGHGCGHCASGSISVHAALALHVHADKLRGSIDIIGTPDEESTGGKITMVEQGLFNDYDFVIMIHMHSKNKVNSKFLALTAFNFKFHGRPAHASSAPWEGKNAMNGALLMIHAFDMMRQHIKPSARIHGIITNGGVANNVIPDFSSAEYCARYPDSEYLQYIVNLMQDCARGAAIATQTDLEITQIGHTLDNMKRNYSGEKLLQEVYEELGESVIVESDENIGSSDIGNVSHKCVALHPYLSVTDEKVSLHTKELAAQMKEKGIEARIDKGAKIMALTILRVLFEPETLATIRKDFKEN